MSIDIATLRPKLEAALGAQLQLGALLGQGGFAAVFRAHDPFLERDVAIKVLDPSLAVDAAREEQFLHEARTIAAAEHPHIVPLYSAESTGGLLYLVMRLLPGQSLKDRIAEGKVPAAEAARIGLECARALAAAHAVGVVHRDIKPGNILLDANGNATVTDFGIALVTSRPARDRKSTRLNSSHSQISYAVFCLKKKKKYTRITKLRPLLFSRGSSLSQRAKLHDLLQAQSDRLLIQRIISVIGPCGTLSP